MKTLLKLMLLIITLNSQAKMFTGTVESSQTQVVNIPQVRGWQAKISEMADEGTFVQEGDFLMRIDGSELDSTIEGKIEQLDVFIASGKRDMIQIQIDLNNAQLNHKKAQVAQKVAKLKADVPVNFIGELEFKERQLTLKKSIKSLDEANNELIAIQKKQQEKQVEINLGKEQKEKDLAYWKGQLDSLTIEATQTGYIVYSSHPWTGIKFQVGDQAGSGMEVLKVSKKNNMKIKAWVNAIDIPNVSKGKAVNINFDALPKTQAKGQITEISSAGRDKKDWGDGLYYEIEIKLSDANGIPLIPGMSALITLTEV